MAWLPNAAILGNEVAPEWLCWAATEPVNSAIAEVLSEKIATLPFESTEYLADAVTVLRLHEGCELDKSPAAVRATLQVERLLARPVVVLPGAPEHQCRNLISMAINFSAKGLTFTKTGDLVIYSTIQSVLTPEQAAGIAVGQTPYDALASHPHESAETVIGEVAMPTLDKLLSKFSPLDSKEPLFLVALYVAIAEMWRGTPPPIRVGVDGANLLESEHIIMLHIFGRYYPEKLVSGIGDGKTLYCLDMATPYFVPSTIINLLRAAGATDWLGALDNPKTVAPGTTLYTWTRHL